MRNLIDVIDDMLSIIPEKEERLIAYFKDIQDSQRYRAPEDIIGWYQIAEELNTWKLNIFSSKWKFQIISIFTTKSIKEIKKELYESKRCKKVKK